MFCASVVYPVDAEGFNFEYFRDHHAPMFAELLGSNCQRFEVHRALATPGAPTPPFAAAAYFWVTSADAFGATLADTADEIYADIANFGRTPPVRGWAEVAPRDTQQGPQRDSSGVFNKPPIPDGSPAGGAPVARTLMVAAIRPGMDRLGRRVWRRCWGLGAV